MSDLYDPMVRACSFSPDGKRLAASVEFTDDELPTIQLTQIWDLESRQLLTTFDGTDGAFTSNGESYVSLSQGKIQLRSAKGFAEIATFDKAVATESPSLTNLSLSHDGTTLVCSVRRNAIHVWNLPTRQEITELAGHRQWIQAVAVSTDGAIVASGSADGTVRVWERYGIRRSE